MGKPGSSSLLPSSQVRKELPIPHKLDESHMLPSQIHATGSYFLVEQVKFSFAHSPNGILLGPLALHFLQFSLHKYRLKSLVHFANWLCILQGFELRPLLFPLQRENEKVRQNRWCCENEIEYPH